MHAPNVSARSASAEDLGAVVAPGEQRPLVAPDDHGPLGPRPDRQRKCEQERRQMVHISNMHHSIVTLFCGVVFFLGCDDQVAGVGHPVDGDAPEADGLLEPEAGRDASPGPGPECAADVDCAADEVCAATGECLFRCSVGGCASGYCGADGRCHDGPCDDDGLCPPASFCDARGICHPGCRVGGCPEGQVCGPDRVCVTDGACLEAELCGNGIDDDCDGVVDDPGVCNAPCVADQPCETGLEGACATGVGECPGGDVGPPVCRAPEPVAEACDGVDQDCDGAVDEDWPRVDEPCEHAAGACAGVWACGDAGLVCRGGGGEAERCNGVDDDCDGATDEDWPRLGEACEAGRGSCAVRGRLGCGDVCDGQPGAAADEICNGLDDDCDGEADEDWPLGGACSVGVGACRVDGRWMCGEAGARCDAVPGAPRPEVCDGADDDCDGRIDEALSRACGARAGHGACRSGSERCEGGAWVGCDAVVPAPERCNEVDDDCDGLTDEAGEPCYGGPEQTVGVGRCRVGARDCGGGVCAGEVRPAVEVCNGADDDCDGSVDEALGCACAPEPCYDGPAGTDGVGVCRAGLRDCEGGGVCAGEVRPAVERCNGADDNCDGVVDEAVLGVGRPCSAGLGACAAVGVTICDGALRCEAAVGAPAAEACNGIDDDCDGRTDEDYGVGAGCSAGIGLCRRAGSTRCGEGGRVVCDAVAGEGGAEICNGADDDCDGLPDEGFDVGRICHRGRGACRADGVVTCAGCTAVVGAAGAEVCNGADDDCDGRIDEGFVLGEACVRGVGSCAGEGVTACGDRGGVVCDASANVGRPEVCNGADDDCDGRSDEALAEPPCPTGEVGACAEGRARCVEGERRCVREVEPVAETCDGADEDCDGAIDEAQGVVGCGLGACAREIDACAVCDPVAGAGVERCDGTDEDCDGVTDEASVDADIPCEVGTGRCRRTGFWRCGDGERSCTATPGEPAGELCNGRDDDCDGAADEGTEGAPCWVGVGACRREAALECAGEVGLECPAAAGAPVAEVCNGIDDDCDGRTDEGFGTEVCGLGACLRAVPACDGEPVEPCEPLAGAEAEVCNGVDDDCDGVVDEAVEVGAPCASGIGGCARDGVTECRGGRVVCGATPGAPGVERCDLVDQDCDGATDEALGLVGCAVGVGACGRPGLAACEGGARRCDAEAGEPEQEVCNGFDDDCDGETDEGFPRIVCGQGACRQTVSDCARRGDVVCDPLFGAAPEACNGVDDDCDGTTDEDAAGGPCGAGVGACEAEGELGCVEGVLRCSAVEGAPAEEVCDGADHDCDGAVDEGVACPDEVPPVVSIHLPDGPVPVGSEVRIQLEGSDDRGAVVDWALSVGGAALAVDGNGAAVWIAVAGRHAVLATGADAAGNVGRAEAVLRAMVAGDGQDPVAEIDSPGEDAVLSEARAVVGTATDANLHRWTLAYVEGEGEDWRTLRAGETPVVAGELGRLDPTSVPSGLYRIRLRVEDVNGRVAEVVRAIRIEGDSKIGRFTISYTDLTIPVAGLPLTIRRTYDSQRKFVGDFGVGWVLDVRQGAFSHNRPPGRDWSLQPAGGLGGFGRCESAELAQHIAEVRLSDRELYVFRLEVIPGFVLQGRCDLVFQYQLVYSTVPGEAELLILGEVDAEYWLADRALRTLGGQPYDIGAVQLRTPDGRAIDLDRDDGVLRILDRNGNLLQIDEDGLLTEGEGVGIERDAAGRIVSVVAPGGERVSYAYDAAGDLVEVTGRRGETVGYGYDGDHNLVRIDDPSGAEPLRNEYDDEGRLVAIVYPDGGRHELAHDVEGRREVLRDRLGAVRVLEYDARGNVLRRTDRRGFVWTHTWDEADNERSRTDPLGETTWFEYDALNRRVREIDPLGGETTYAYDGGSLRRRLRTGGGSTTRWDYDGQGNLVQETDATGAVSSHTYDARGNRLTTTDALGGVQTWTYDGSGRVLTETDALGRERRLSYDAEGRQIEVLRVVGPEELARTKAYDVNGRLTERTDLAGERVGYEYEAHGWISARIDPLGGRTEYTYDGAGNVVRTEYPDGGVETAVWDAEGRRIEQTDRAGRLTRYAYDAEGNPVRVTRPDGGVVQLSYDALGRLASETDALGAVTTYAYDALGRLVRSTDALGQETAYLYDDAGRRISTTDPDGRTTRWEYDAMGRRTATVFHDGRRSETGYDVLGRRVSVRDPNGHLTRYRYDLAGQLIEVTDALGGRIALEYDAMGNRSAMEDAGGHQTELEHDAVGRITAKIRPGGGRTEYEYDAVGNLVARVFADGTRTERGYDAMNRLTSRVLPTGVEVTTLTPTGRRDAVRDARGVTRWEWDASDRLLRRMEPDGATLAYTYDAEGRRTSLATAEGVTRYTYDAVGRLRTVVASDGGVFEMSYDEAGRRVELVRPNGLVTTYGYDAAGRLERVETFDGEHLVAGFVYTLGDAGERLSVEELHRERVVEYAYDALYRLLEERVGDRTIRYTYDAAGNRLRREDGAEVTVYGYDEHGRLESVDGVPWTQDERGRVVDDGERTYEWDALDRLVAVEVGEVRVEYTYDVDGNRVAEAVRGPDGDVETRRLVDTTGSVPEAVLETGPGGVRSYLLGDDLLAVHRDGAWRYPIADAQRSIRLVTGPAGAVVETIDYDAFGRVLDRGGEGAQRRLFTGQARDPNTGLDDLRARWLSPDSARFLSLDPVEPNPVDPRTLHPYVYAGNDPINHYDPRGETLISLSISISVNMVVSSMYVGETIKFFLRAQQLSYCSMPPAYAVRELGLRMITLGIRGVRDLQAWAADDRPGLHRDRERGVGGLREHRRRSGRAELGCEREDQRGDSDLEERRRDAQEVVEEGRQLLPRRCSLVSTALQGVVGGAHPRLRTGEAGLRGRPMFPGRDPLPIGGGGAGLSAVGGAPPRGSGAAPRRPPGAPSRGNRSQSRSR